MARSSRFNDLVDETDGISVEIGPNVGFRRAVADDARAASEPFASREATRPEPINTVSELLPKRFGLRLAATSYLEAYSPVWRSLSRMCNAIVTGFRASFTY